MLTPIFQTPLIDLYNGDCLAILKQLPDESVDCCITSPPYYLLRDYNTATWQGGDPDCDHVINPGATKTFGNPEFNENRPSREATKTPGYYAKDTCPHCGAKRVDYQVGLEPTVSEYISKLQTIFVEVQRVLKPTGTCWVNLGDSFGGSGKGRSKDGTPASMGKIQQGNRGSADGLLTSIKDVSIRPKSLCLVPQRFAIACAESGWIIRNEVIWLKSAPMPSSKKDAMTVAHETIWFMTKEPRYYYDYEAVKQPLKTPSSLRKNKRERGTEASQDRANAPHRPKTIWNSQQANVFSDSETRNLWDVWHLSPDPVPDAHFATFPREIPKRAILAGCPPDGVVLDIFAGSGTTLLVAKELGRKAIRIELNPKYCEIITKRCNQLTIYDAFSQVESN